MLDFEWNPNSVPNIKLGLHAAQLLLSFVLWCMEIAVFAAEDAQIVGNNGWTFGVCFLSIPAWIYLVMTPRFERTRRFANPHAMLCVDALFVVIWLSAFATQAAYNTADLCGTACGVSMGIVGLGVIITLLFGATTFISGYSLQYYNFHGTLPGYDNRQVHGQGDNIDPDKAAFSMAPHEEEAYQRINPDDNEASGSGYGGNGSAYDAGYGNPNPYSHDDNDPNRFGSMQSRTSDRYGTETEYSSGLGQPMYSATPAPSEPYGSQLSYGPPSTVGRQELYEDSPAQFPAADYDRVQR